jgi:hypothetical protein
MSEQKQSLVFLDYFSEMTDPRQAGKVLYPLSEVMLLALCGVLAGADDFVECPRGRNRIEPLLDAVEPPFDAVHAQRLAGNIAAKIGDLALKGGDPAFEGRDPASVLRKQLDLPFDLEA